LYLDSHDPVVRKYLGVEKKSKKEKNE
jgi:hypothetical protein